MPVFCLSISDYVYTAFLFKLTTDGLDSIEPSSYTWLFLYPLLLYMGFLEANKSIQLIQFKFEIFTSQNCSMMDKQSGRNMIAVTEE